MPIENEKCFHHGVAGAFVAVHKGMIEHDEIAQGGRFRDQPRIEVLGIECGAGLGDGRFEGAKIADAGASSGTRDDAAMQFEDFWQGEVAHQESRL